MKDRMQRSTVLIVRLLAVSLAVQARAGLVIDEPIYDFGTRYNTLPIAHAWKLRNTGTTDLDIAAVISGCDRCLSFALDRYEIKPGTHSDLHVILEPLGHEGAIEKSLTIESNTGGAPRKVTIRGRFLRAYHLAPAALTFTQSTGHKEARWQDLQLTPLTPLKGTLQQVLSTNEKVKGTIVPGKKPGSYTIRVECLADWPDGRSEVELRIYSDDPEDPVGRVLVQVHQPSELQAIPGKLLLERTDPLIHLVAAVASSKDGPNTASPMLAGDGSEEWSVQGGLGAGGHAAQGPLDPHPQQSGRRKPRSGGVSLPMIRI